MGYWLSEAGPAEPRAPLDRDASFDVVIVGGGYAGMWTAWSLVQRQPGIRVAVLEAGVCGEGPSGRNAGFVNSFWHHLAGLEERFGDGPALELCEQADRSVRQIGEWARERDLDVWFREAGHLKVATSPAQEGVWMDAVRACERLGAGAQYVDLDPEGVAAICRSPHFGGGVLMAGSASVQPARLARGLRAALTEAGVAVYEGTRAIRIAGGAQGVTIETAGGGRARAPSAVVAINAASAGFEPLRNRLVVSSTHMLVTEPVPDVLEGLGWTGGECISTARTYLHYFRTTPDDRIAFGWGGGRLACGARLGGRIHDDPEVAERLRTDLVRLFPALEGRRIEGTWGGPVDVSPERLPVLGTLPDGRTHYVYGFTGNGVGPSHLAGRVLASMALDSRDELTRLPIVEPPQPRVPPEPLRFIGGSLVRAALLRKERREDEGSPADPLTDLVVEMPRMLGIHVGR